MKLYVYLQKVHYILLDSEHFALCFIDKKSKIVCYDIVPFRADTRKNKNFEAAQAISAKQTLKEKAPVVE